MTPQILQANSRVVEDYGRVAVQRGPVVYCLEQLDQQPGIALTDLALPNTSTENGFSESFEKNLLDGVVVLHHEGIAVQPSAQRRSLYFPVSAAPNKSTKAELTFIPYYAWANREPTPMQVWTPLQKS